MQPNKIQFLLNRLYQLNPPDRIELTLDRIQRLLKDLKHPEQQLSNVITVTGTNGKGSTCEYLKNILKEHGYSVNVYTSPHIVKFNERIFLKQKLTRIYSKRGSYGRFSTRFRKRTSGGRSTTGKANLRVYRDDMSVFLLGFYHSSQRYFNSVLKRVI